MNRKPIFSVNRNDPKLNLDRRLQPPNTLGQSINGKVSLPLFGPGSKASHQTRNSDYDGPDSINSKKSSMPLSNTQEVPPMPHLQ